MSIGSINPLSSGYLQSILGGALQGVASKKAGASSSGVDAASSVQQPDNSRLSPFAQVLSELQQLQQSNPTQYQQVTQQIATNLNSAAQTAQSGGNSTAASQLNQLATDFTNASTSGQLPNVQDLAQAISTGHHHHHHQHASGGSSNSSSGSNANQELSQLLAAFQANASPSGTLDPLSIIGNTLSSAGVGATSS